MNRILLSQKLCQGKILELKDIEEIQKNDSKILGIINNISSKPNNNFVIKNGILYRTEVLLSGYVDKLVLPNYISSQILNHLHHDKQYHISANQMKDCFSSTFYTPNLLNLCQSVSNSCGACNLNNNLYKKQTSGDKRSVRDELRPGSHLSMDALYLNKTDSGNKYAYIFVCMLTGYTSILPTHSLNCSTAKTAVRNLFSILPTAEEIYTDNGPEFSKPFTVYLASLGILHSGDIARRSQQQAAAENSIRLAKNLLLKITSTKDFERRNWDLALPIPTSSRVSPLCITVSGESTTPMNPGSSLCWRGNEGGKDMSNSK